MNEMTRLVLPQMADRKKGAVINLSSLSGAMCTPLLSVYSGTKAYVDKWETMQIFGSSVVNGTVPYKLRWQYRDWIEQSQ